MSYVFGLKSENFTNLRHLAVTVLAGTVPSAENSDSRSNSIYMEYFVLYYGLTLVSIAKRNYM